MSRGKRYDAEPKLNAKKVLAVVIAIVVIIMFVYMIKGILSKGDQKGKITSQSYFSAFQDNKWGVINGSAETVIAPSYQEMIVIPDNKTDIFLCTYDVNYDTGEYKTKALNAKNEEILTQYDQVEAISNKDSSHHLWYEENVLKVMKDGKYGMIQFGGKQVLDTIYDDISAVVGIKNAFLILKDGKYGVADNEGKVVLQPNYIEITNLGKDNKAGYIVKDESGKYGVVDYSANVVLELKYDGISNVYGNDCYVVTLGGKKRIVTKDGSDVLTTGFDDVKQMLKVKEDGVIFSKAGKYGVMKLTGEITIPATFESLEEAKSGVFIAKKAGKYGVITNKQEEKVPFSYEMITYQNQADMYLAEDSNFVTTIMNSNLETKVTGFLLEMQLEKGYFSVKENDEVKYYSLKFEEKKDSEILINNTLFLTKKDGKYGFIDKSGATTVECIYDDATQQNTYGFAGIKKDGKWGSIDNKGNVVQEPIYDLENYLLVDFIGRWHLGFDVNMNYYNQD